MSELKNEPSQQKLSDQEPWGTRRFDLVLFGMGCFALGVAIGALLS